MLVLISYMPDRDPTASSRPKTKAINDIICWCLEGKVDLLGILSESLCPLLELVDAVLLALWSVVGYRGLGQDA
jgi:hypothetical protein